MQRMTPQNAGKAGRKLWREHRKDYMEKRKFGEEQKTKDYEKDRTYINYYDENKLPTAELIDYDGRTWQENRAIVRAQIMAMKYSRNIAPLVYTLPPGLSDNAIQVCESVLTGEHIHPVSKLIRHSNGRKMNTAAIGELAGITGRRTLYNTLKELVDRGVFMRIQRGEYKANENIFKKI